jgi:hypothetical protein
MRRYHSDSESDGDKNVASPSKAQAGQGYLQYIAEYENNQDSDEDASFTEQGRTVEGEYNAYISSTPNLKCQVKPKIVDPLKFWDAEVSIILFTLMI